MSALTLRIIASLCMLIDHAGLFFDFFIFRLIGRIAFPLYAFLLVNGFRHTKNRLRYACRLAIFAVISQIPFMMLTYSWIPLRAYGYVLARTNFFQLMIYDLNVLVTLFLGLLGIWAGEALRKHKWTRYICLLPSILLYFVYYFGYLRSDYGGTGIMLITIYWFFEGKKVWMTLGTLFAFYHGLLLSYAHDIYHGIALSLPQPGYLIPLCTLLALPLMFSYNGKPGRMPQNRSAKKTVQLGFYAFYPLHIVLLRLLSSL